MGLIRLIELDVRRFPLPPLSDYNVPMFDTLLQTKLYMPPLRREWVPRPRLLAALSIQPQTKLILISAPAGYGKTTLVTAWLRQIEAAGSAQVSWLALDEEDNEPQQFFRYLAAAVQPLPGVQSFLPQLLQANQDIPTKTLLKAFVQDVTAISTPFILVLDDYHVLDNAKLDNALAALCDLLPPQMTLVLTSRSDPGFPISRLRGRGQLIELRAADLRFTEAEAAQFLQQTMGLTLSPEQIAALENRTEGWIAGLQMAALSIQNRVGTDLDKFVHSFTGSHRFVLDYLVEEALDQQPEPVRAFLLATSILDRLSGPLCDAVTGQADGQALLERLERDNLFMVPLDDERRWYRYHHLFADVLQAHALTKRPNQVADWHRRASEWFAQQGARADAIRHALAAKDFTQAACLIELIRPTIDGTYQIDMWLGWAESLPEELIRERPVLSAGYAWALLENGHLADSKARLQDAERWLNASSSGMVVADDAQWQTLPASLAAAHAYYTLALGDVAAAVHHAQQALDFFSNEDHDHHWRGVALSLLGLTHWINGDLESSAHAFANLTKSMIKIGKLVDAISTTYVLAEMQIAQGQLKQAEQTLQQCLQAATRQAEPLPLGASDLYRLLGDLAWERGNLDKSRNQLQTATTLGEQAALTNWAHRLCLTQAQIKQSQGDLSGALALLEEAEGLYVENPVPVVRPVAALKAKIWTVQGELDNAWAWAQAQGLSSADDLSYLQEFEHLTLARLLLAQYQRNWDAQALNDASGLLARLRSTAEAGGRMGSVLEILLLQALAHAAQNDIPTALIPLKRALALAEPQGYVRRFVDEGPPMAALLQAALKEGITVPYVTRLLAAFGEVGKKTAVPQPLIDPLSERELEILALIATGLKNKEVAAQLLISLNTVLYHTKNIYGKLGVNKRILAVAKARELGLL